MMRSIIKYVWICIFLCAGFSSKGSDSTQIFSYADSLYNAEQYRAAGIAYERVAYKTEKERIKALALLKKGECLLSKKKFTDVSKTLERANLQQLSDTLRFQIRYKTALANYLNEDFTGASDQLKRLYFYQSDTNLLIQSYYLHALVLNELAEWEQAKNKLLLLVKHAQLSKSTKDSMRNKINRIYTPENYPKLKEFKTAKLLSSFLPGAGQIYAGYPVEGLTNLALQLGSIAFGAYSIYHGYYITGIIIGGTAYRTFFMGGIRHLKYLVDKRNHHLLRSYNDKLQAVILSIEAQRRP